MRYVAILLLFFAFLDPPASGRAWDSRKEELSSRASSYLKDARKAASQDRHLDAIRLYNRVILADSTLKEEIAIELGHQYTWADMPDSAIRWYELYLSRHPDDMEASLGLARALSWADRLEESESHYRKLLKQGESENEVLLGLARVVSWQDRISEAKDLYSEVLNRAPDNREARIGLAQMENWSGRHRKALEMYLKILEDNAGDQDALRGAAAAENWMGLPYKALDRLERAEREAEAVRMQGEIKASLAPQGKLDFASTKDSDEIKIEKLAGTFETHSEKMILMSGNYSRAKITQNGNPDINRNAITIVLRKRFSPSFSLTLSPGYERNRFDYFSLPPGNAWNTNLNIFVFDGYLTITPVDWFRFDAGYSRKSLDIPLSIFKGVVISILSLGMDKRFSTSTAMHAAMKFFVFSDTNRKLSLSQNLEWNSPWGFPFGFKNHLSFSPGYDYFHFRRTLANGYYNPRDYLNVFFDANWKGDITTKTSFDVKGRISLERENNRENAIVGAIEGSVDVKLTQKFAILAGYHNSRSRLDSPTGYRYRGFYLNLQYRF